MPTRRNGLRRVLQLAPRSAGNGARPCGALALLRDAYVGAAFVRRGGELPPGGDIGRKTPRSSAAYHLIFNEAMTTPTFQFGEL